MDNANQSILSYESLAFPRQIRLLHIPPRKPGEPIQCELKTVCLDDDNLPPFIALSYCWGPVDTSQTIFVNRQKKPVSETLHDALNAISDLSILDKYGRNIWIDAICINQSDVDEKTIQVRLMDRIYSSASTVLAWLGNYEDSDHSALALINDVVTKLGLSYYVIADNPDSFKKNASPSQLETAAAADSLGIPPVGHPDWFCVAHFFRKPWFSRLWIIQECVMARDFNLLCGSNMIPAEPLFIFCSNVLMIGWLLSAVRAAERFHPHTKQMMEHHHRKTSWQCLTTLAEWRISHQRGFRRSLDLCMNESIDFQATDGRDRVFAMIALCSDVGTDTIDYNLSSEELVTKIGIRQYQEAQGRTDIVSHSQMFKRLPGVPSWIPCWTEALRASPMPLHFEYSSGTSINDYGASSVNRGLYQPNRGPSGVLSDGSLVVGSQAVDSIVLLPQVPGQQVFADWTKTPSRDTMYFNNPDFVKWEHEVLTQSCAVAKTPFQQAALVSDLIDEYPNGEQVEECILRSVFHDDQHLLPAENFATWVSASYELIEDIYPRMIQLTSIRGARETLPGWVPNSTWQDYANNREWTLLTERHDRALLTKQSAITALNGMAHERNRNRVLALTAHGYIAWVPSSAAISDEIHIIDGTRVPILLRRDPTRPEPTELEMPYAGGIEVEAWNVVGDVYLHGFMTGPLEEAMRAFGWTLGEGKRHVWIF